MKERKPAYNTYRIIGLLLIVFVLAAYFVLIMKNGQNLIDSDDASELILGKLLSEELRPITTNWLYSYELRVLNIQLVFMPLFWIFHSWKMVRAMGGIILLLIYLLSYYSVYAAWKLDKRWFYLTAFALIMPFAKPLYYFNLKLFYIPHISISFFSFAIFGMIADTERKRKGLWIGLLCILSFLAGLGGARSVLLTFLPLFCCAVYLFLEERCGIREPVISGVSLMISGIGFLINDRILTKYFQYWSYSGLSFIKFSFERLENILNSMINTFGYSVGEYFISFQGILNVFAILLTVFFSGSIVICWVKRDELGEKRCMVSLFVAFTFLLNTAVTLMGQLVNDEYADRYIAIGIVPALLLPGMVYPVLKLSERLKRTILIACLSAVFLMGLIQYRLLITYDGNAARQGYLNYLEEQGLDYGYASFWNANVTTEMSDGKVLMTGLVSSGDHFEITYHLVDTKLAGQHHDRSFLLLANREIDEFMLGKEKLANLKQPDYQDDAFAVFVFDEDLDELYDESLKR